MLNILLNLVFELKFLDVFMGREDPIEFNIWFAYLLVVCLLLVSGLYCFVGVMRGMV